MITTTFYSQSAIFAAPAQCPTSKKLYYDFERLNGWMFAILIDTLLGHNIIIKGDGKDNQST